METALDLSRWREKPHGVNYRRWVILSNGLRQLLKTRFFKALVYLAWFGGLLIALAGYLVGQFVADGGWVQTAAESSSPRAMALHKTLVGLVTLFPDIIVGGVYTLFFWLHSFLGLVFCLVGLTVMVPQLVTRDRASNALTIYLSRPLTSGDYLLGKFGMVVGLLGLVWTGPLLFGWAVSMLLTAEMDFVVHSIPPLLRALAFNGIALAALAPIALGVSALIRSPRGTIGLWLGIWLGGWLLAVFPDTPGWLKRASFMHDLNEVRLEVLPLDQALTDAATKLPIYDEGFLKDLNRAASRITADEFQPAMMGLCVLVAISGTVFLRRIRPE